MKETSVEQKHELAGGITVKVRDDEGIVLRWQEGGRVASFWLTPLQTAQLAEVLDGIFAAR